MRRSAAPSQFGGAAKRPRFNSPYLSTSQQNNDTSQRSTTDILGLIAKSKTTNEGGNSFAEVENPAFLSSCPSSAEFSVQSDTVQSDLKENQPVINSNITSTSVSQYARSAELPDEPIMAPAPRYQPKFKSFKGPSMNRAPTHSPQPNQCVVESRTVNPATVPSSDSDPSSRYFNVMWCKRSARKHKKWEGDAILITKGRTVKLLDTDGKEIGQGSGYKIKELETLEEGHTLAVGGKEIEVMSVLPVDDYTSGKCFAGGMSTSSIDEAPAALKTSSVIKPFTKPQKAGQNIHGLQTINVQPGRPRYDVNAPNALVLPRPSQSHQWEHNAGQSTVIDVVVDPYLSQHLRPHQRAGVVFLYECVMGIKNSAGKGAILADEMGLGKTLQCIALVWTLLKQGPYGCKPMAKKVLIITPGSLVKNWLREFKKWLGTERIKVFAVTQNNKVQEFVDSPIQPVMVISYEMFVRNIDTIHSLNFDLVICDEGHRLKNTTIKTTTLVNSLSCRRRVMLTGTPVQNDLQELFSLIDFCNPGILGTASSFRHVYEDPILTSRRPSATIEERTLGETRAAELNRITSMFILRRTSDINNTYLPPKVDVVLFCRPSTLQLSLYRRLLSSRVVRSCLYTRDMAQHLMCISALRKLCNHPSLLYNKSLELATSDLSNMEDNGENELYHGLYDVYPEGYDPTTVQIEEAGKLCVLAQLLASFYTTNPQERVVLVSNYTQTLDCLERLCKACNYQCLRLDGQTPTGKRQQLVERFNSRYSTDFVFLLSSKAGGIGLNLIGASRLVLYDVDWNPANDLQAMARVWRDGQRRTVYIYRLLTTGSIKKKKVPTATLR